MRTRFLSLVLIAAALPLLGGCKSLFSEHARLSHQPRIRVDLGALAGEELATGKAALARQDYAAAITAFRSARIDPASAAEASNGLAIGYAGIGRPDLAERYFVEALALAPGNDRYQANLVRLRRTALASAAPGERPAPAPSAKAAASNVTVTRTSAARSAVRIETPSTHLVRLSSGEVRLGAQAPRKAEPALAMGPARPAAWVQPVPSASAIKVESRTGILGSRTLALADFPFDYRLQPRLAK